MNTPESEHKRSDPKTRDVRAGPGDAGASDRPVHREETPRDRREGRKATNLLLWLVGIGFVIVFVLNMVALL
ncbi:hypothetical protein [Salipiger sp.]|uniref:hypothetical protein n=1 Tax=Salipiger sp. TaxID=2078585 RepID=UPI003A98219D